MKMRMIVTLTALSILMASPAKADITYNFTDGTTTGWSGVNGGAVSNAIDTGSRALKLTTNLTNQSAIGTMPTVILTNIGDSVQLSFNFRFDSLPSDIPAGFRFALSNSLGTGGTDDDVGYYISLSTGTVAGASTHQIWRETGTLPPYLGGTDRVPIGAINTSDPKIADTVQRTGTLTLTKSGATSTNISASINGTPYFTSITDTAGLFTYDSIGFSSANQTRNMWFDNVVVTFAPVPEPSSMALVFAAGSGFLMQFGRRRMRTRRERLAA